MLAFRRAWGREDVIRTYCVSHSGPDRLDYCPDSDLIAQNIFREIKDPEHPLHYSLPHVKVSYSRMVLQPSYPCQLTTLNKATVYRHHFELYCISNKFYSSHVVIFHVSF